MVSNLIYAFTLFPSPPLSKYSDRIGKREDRGEGGKENENRKQR